MRPSKHDLVQNPVGVFKAPRTAQKVMADVLVNVFGSVRDRREWWETRDPADTTQVTVTRTIVHVPGTSQFLHENVCHEKPFMRRLHLDVFPKDIYVYSWDKRFVQPFVMGALEIPLARLVDLIDRILPFERRTSRYSDSSTVRALEDFRRTAIARAIRRTAAARVIQRAYREARDNKKA